MQRLLALTAVVIGVLCLAQLFAWEDAQAMPSGLRPAYRQATRYLHGKLPCGGHLRIGVGSADTSVHEAAKEYGSGAEPFSWQEGCAITFNSYWWTPTTERIRSKLLCVLMIHELGNAAGLPETFERFRTHNVRDAFGEYVVPPPACR
jgi:hypothetical protein